MREIKRQSTVGRWEADGGERGQKVADVPRVGTERERGQRMYRGKERADSGDRERKR
jgi:hypothetical protein